MALSNTQRLAINVYASSASMSKIVIGTSLIQVFPACFAMLLDGLQVGYIPPAWSENWPQMGHVVSLRCKAYHFRVKEPSMGENH